MRVTFYPHTLAADSPVGRDLSWGALSASLRRFRPISGDKDHRLRTAPLWSPVALKVPHRASDNVEAVTCLVLDYDDDAALQLADAMDRWEGYRRCGYTTWSHQADAPRCRVVLPLARPIPAEWWSDLYRMLLDGQGQGADRVCLDPSRAYYLPCDGRGGPHAAAEADGDLLDLWEEAKDLAEAKAQREAEAKRRRDAQLARLRRPYRDATDRDRAARRILDIDPTTRESLADRVGAQVRQGGHSGAFARRAPCPQCGRHSVWWALDRGRAFCNHRNSCGYAAPLYDYALSFGQEAS